MINKEIYANEPKPNRILNQGIAEVSEEYNEDALAVLRYEMETFICEGQYKKGLELVLDNFLRNLASNAPVQKGAWISGFYGSGKSHLVKMLRILWTDYIFPDGASARGIASLPDEIRDLLKELTASARRNGAGTFAAAGKMGSGGGDSVRLIVLGILFKAAGFSEQYAQARFMLWLRREGKLEAFKERIASSGKDLKSELSNLYVSPLIGKILIDLFPDQFSNIEAVQDRLVAQFTQPKDISDDELVTTIKELLNVDGKMPLTLVVLDEIQQYIGKDPKRTYQVNLVAETLCHHFKSRLMLVGTGQSALADTPDLQPLMARFPLHIPLTENDVDQVIRRNILAKKNTAEPVLKDYLSNRAGEISRHLQGTLLAHSSDDDKDLVSDYPLLPTRRRFWEHVLRSVDPTGATAQLRNQLRIVDEAVLATAQLSIGNIVAGDFIFDQIAPNLVASQALSRESFNRITTLSASTSEEERLLARILKLVFLVNKLPNDPSVDTKLRATADNIVDLLVENLDGDTEKLRQTIPSLLARLEASHDLMSLKGSAGIEYRLQTRESAEWYDEYKAHEARFKGNSNIVSIKRDERIKKWFEEHKSSFIVRQGRSNTIRAFDFIYGSRPNGDVSKRLTLWVRDGFTIAEATALAEARALNTAWPVVVVYLPDDFSNELFNALVVMEASKATLQSRGVPKEGSPGDEARKSIESRLSAAELEVQSYIEETLQRSKVWLAGGSEVTNGIGLEAQVCSALETAANRLYSKFSDSDKPEWAEVVRKAQHGDREALRAIGYVGDPSHEPVCRKVLDEIGAGKKGADIRDTFLEAPYGWTQDTIDGALYVLLANEMITAFDASNKSVSYSASTLSRQKIGQTNFYREDEPLTMTDRLALRGLYQEAGIACRPGEEVSTAATLIEILKQAAQAAGGEPPLPPRPELPLLQEIEGLMGNKKLKRLLEKKSELIADYKKWIERAALIKKRQGAWETLEKLIAKLNGIMEVQSVIEEYESIIQQRRLLAEPDPVESLIRKAAEILRHELNEKAQSYRDTYFHLAEELKSNPLWEKLSSEEWSAIFLSAKIEAPAPIDVSGPYEILKALESRSLEAWDAHIAALPSRFEQAMNAAIKKLEPKIIPIRLPSRVIKTKSEAEAWLAETRRLIEEGLERGPVSV